jgi:hypothetical protein
MRFRSSNGSVRLNRRNGPIFRYASHRKYLDLFDYFFRRAHSLRVRFFRLGVTIQEAGKKLRLGFYVQFAVNVPSVCFHCINRD